MKHGKHSKFVVSLSQLQVQRPRRTKDYNRNHQQSGPDGGRFTSGTSQVAFEVAPDPDNKEQLAAWNALSDAQKAKITEQMTAKFLPQIEDALGVEGSLIDTFGGYEGQINPARILAIDDKPFEMAGAIGTVFDQKAMVIIGTEALPGLDENGVISVFVPKGNVTKLRALEKRLGEFAAGGWTYEDGKMQMLNFSGQTDKDYATAIDKTLGGDYEVGHGKIHSALIGRNEYVSPRNDKRGNPWGPISDRLRDEFARELGAKIKGQKGRGKADQISDDYNPNQPRDPGGEGGGRWIKAGGPNGDEKTLIDPGVKKTLTPDQIAALAKAATDGTVDEILDAMAPVYEASGDAAGASTMELDADGNPPEGFFDERVYNLPNGENTNLEGAVRFLMDEGERFAGPGGPGQDRKSILLIGPPAAGKSTLAEGLAVQGYAIVDADEAKKLIPEYNGGLGSGVVHEESSAISKMVAARFTNQGTNVVLQTVSTGPASAIKKVNQMHRLNYEVALVGMEIDPDIAAQRMARRYIKTGRFVPGEVVRSAPVTSMATYEALKGTTDGHAKVDSGKPGNPVVESTLKWLVPGKPLLGGAGAGR